MRNNDYYDDCIHYLVLPVCRSCCICACSQQVYLQYRRTLLRFFFHTGFHEQNTFLKALSKHNIIHAYATQYIWLYMFTWYECACLQFIYPNYIYIYAAHQNIIIYYNKPYRYINNKLINNNLLCVQYWTRRLRTLISK